MTVTDNGATADATGFTVEDDRILARAAWREDRSLTGKQLGERFGKSRRWGQNQRAAAEREVGGRGTGADPGEGTQAVPRPTPKPKPAARPRHVETATPLALRLGQLAGFVVVAAVCAVLSYNHVRDLAILVGLDNPSWVPLGIDGLMVVTTCSLMIDKRAGRESPAVTRVGLVVGIVGTLTANALAVNPDLDLDRWSIMRMVIAVYPPITLAVVLHLVFFRPAVKP